MRSVRRRIPARPRCIESARRPVHTCAMDLARAGGGRRVSADSPCPCAHPARHGARDKLTVHMCPVDQQGRGYGRSMVIARRGIAATSQVQASQSAAQILARGGSAVDAAIAANAVLAVLEPMQCGPGGDLFVLHWEAATGKLTGLNASGPAPRALSPAYLASKGF